jgi:hypothetical protein
MMAGADIIWNQDLHRLAQELRAHVAEQLLRHFVEQCDLPFAIDFDNRVGRCLQKLTKARILPFANSGFLLLFCKVVYGCFRFPARGYVRKNDEGAKLCAGRVTPGNCAHL